MNAAVSDAINPLRNWARYYAQSGLRVFPLPPGLKAPRKGELGISSATTDLSRIDAWWTAQPDANIGASGAFRLDVDQKHGGMTAWAALQEKHGAAPTRTARTPSGGLHLWFHTDRKYGNSEGALPDGINVRGHDTGYCVMPPSWTREIPGKQCEGRYEWLDVHAPIAPAPQWLLDLIGTPPVCEQTQTPIPTEATDQQIADLRSALLSPGMLSDWDRWVSNGLALLSLGDIGRELWLEYSAAQIAACSTKQVGEDNAESFWDRHYGHTKPKSGFRSIFKRAKVRGWSNPMHDDPSRLGFGEGPAPAGMSRVPIPPPPRVLTGTTLTPPPSYVLDKKMQYPATIENLVYVLSGQRQTALGFDQFRGRIMIASAGTDNWQPLSDTDMIQLRETLAREQRFAPISKDLMHDALQLVAERYSFDSAITWLNGLAWDGVPRVEEFLVTHCGAVDDAYARAVSLYIWSGLAARVLDPGCQLDMVVALQSPQGKQKSTGLQAMVPVAEWFTDGLTLHEDDDNFKRLIRGKLVVEIAEMAGLSKADINHLKRSITRRTEEWIEKWKTQPSRYERRCMLFATTNEEQFLPPDETGNRRWLPVEVAGLDRDRIAADRLQLWAEGAVIWRKQRSVTGKSGVLWAEAERLAAGLHQKYEVTDLWEADIQRWLNTPSMFPPPLPPGQVPPPPAPAPCERPLALSEVLQGALKLDPARQDAKAEKRGGRVMRQLGYEKRDVKVDGKSVKRWMRVA